MFNLKEDYRTKWFPKDHLTSVDFEDGKGGYKTFRLTIKSIKTEKLMQEKTRKKEEKPVMFFENAKKYMILNVTICKALHEITGSPIPADWIGKEVELFVERGVHTPQGLKDVPRIRKASGFRPNKANPANIPHPQERPTIGDFPIVEADEENEPNPVSAMPDFDEIGKIDNDEADDFIADDGDETEVEE